MNKEFMKKMIQAKMLEYEAIKEIIPESISSKVEEFQKDFLTILYEAVCEKKNNETKKEEVQKIKKIGVEFN